MLVLSRKPKEKIVIGNEIVIEVLSVSGEGVRLGIKAPSETSIHRHEVFVEIEQANQAAEVVLEKIDQSSLENLSVHFKKK